MAEDKAAKYSGIERCGPVVGKVVVHGRLVVMVVDVVIVVISLVVQIVVH